jgi:hypothetical protein
MPYITQEKRNRLLTGDPNAEIYAGDLNFMFSHLISEFINNRTLSYQLINDIVGALEGAKLEFYRRVAAPYEDKKILENGDVY